MSDIVVNCPNCNQDYTIDPSTLGRQFKCVQCGQTFTATAPATGPATGAVPPPPQPVSSPASYQQASVAPPSYLGEAPPGLAPRSTAALASMICGFLCWIWPVSIAGLVLGIVAIGKTRNNQMRGGGMAVTGIVLGAIGLIVDLPLMFCVGPMLFVMITGGGQFRPAMNAGIAQQNLQQIGVAMTAYKNQNSGEYPPDLETLITTQGLDTKLFVYPGSTDTAAPTASQLEAGGHLSYVYLGGGNIPILNYDRVVLYEDGPGHLISSVRMVNVLYADGHPALESKAAADAKIKATREALKLPAAGN